MYRANPYKYKQRELQNLPLLGRQFTTQPLKNRPSANDGMNFSSLDASPTRPPAQSDLWRMDDDEGRS
ncbi:unnamed protein product [Onchocerca flexuosa]|uniref:Uncharacterized protein n=1 Tax=Onchocerca flexuosa TaxID=387005 RepID=A0A183H8T1_9BILA|nr:unnamed protein product [Onchocerca flexuosa]